MRNVCTRLILLSSALLPLSVSVNADDWPQWRGPNRDGISIETNLDLDWTDAAPKLLWRTEGVGQGYSGVSVVDGIIYTTGNTSTGQSVMARKATDGSEVWTTAVTDTVPKHGYDGARCTPSITAEHVYVVTSNGQITCLNKADGKVTWSKDFKEWNGKMMSGWGFSESPTVDGDIVLCTPGGDDALVVALDRFTGKEIWKSPSFKSDNGKDGAGYSSIAIGHACGVKQYVTLSGRGVVGIDASNGKTLWTYASVANKTANIPTPIVFDDYVFCSSGYGTGSALLHITQDGKKLNAKEEYFLDAGTLQNHHGGMIKVGDYIYCGNGHNNGMPTCLKIDSGEVVWGGKLRGVGKGSAAVTVAGDHVLFRYESGEIASIKVTPEGYQPAGDFMPAFQEGKSWAHPVIVDGKLYLREQNVLMCYDVAKN